MSGPKAPPASRRTGIVAASVLVHLLVLAFVAHRSRVWVAPVRLPGTARGAHMVLTYLPGPAPSASAVKARTKPSPALVRTKVSLAANAAVARAMPDKAAPAHEDPGSGVDALGEGDVSIALMQFFPDPRPDLSKLPHGIRGDVVLAAVIDADGRIAQLTVKQSLGYGVDESVIAAVQQWTFHPAMRDGKPVASQQEFHFHYERG